MDILAEADLHNKLEALRLRLDNHDKQLGRHSRSIKGLVEKIGKLVRPFRHMREVIEEIGKVKE